MRFKLEGRFFFRSLFRPTAAMSISPFRRTPRLNNGHDISRSAIVFWHTARGCPQTVRALPLSDIESAVPGVRVSEKTICTARYRGERFPCIVLWIEDKSADELVVSRLLPSANLRIFEEKGMRWAEELGVLQHDVGEFPEIQSSVGQSSFADDSRFERHRYSYQRNEHDNTRSDREEKEFPVVDPEAPQIAGVHGASSITSTSTCGSSNEMSSGTLPRMGGTSVICQPRKQALPRKITLPQHELAMDSEDDESGTLRESKQEEDQDDFEHGDDEGDEAMTDPQSESEVMRPYAVSVVQGASSVPTDPILKKMVLETSWTKALRVAMMDLFSTEELATSLPHQPKAGMRVLDQFRLSIVKDLLGDWCVARTAQVPTRRHLCQAIHNCLISCRTSKYKLKKYGEGNIPGKPTRSMDFGDQRRSTKKF